MQLPHADGLFWVAVGGAFAPHPAEPDYSRQRESLLARLKQDAEAALNQKIDDALYPHRVELPAPDGVWYVMRKYHVEKLGVK